MNSTSGNSLVIESPPDQAVEQVLNLLFTGQLSPVEVALPSIHLDGLFRAARNNQTVGAILVELLPGRTAVVFIPRLVPGEPSSTSVALLERVNALCKEQGVILIQAQLLPNTLLQTREAFRITGFECNSTLIYLVAEEVAFPMEKPSGRLEFLPSSGDDDERMINLLEKTYVNSMDFPELENARPLTDVLESYRATGEYGSENWFFVQHLGEDIGCLILTGHTAQHSMELIYMGIIEPARGNGFGTEIATFAQWRAREGGFREIALGVDVRNTPAMAMYKEIGFLPWYRRDLFLKRVSSV